ncbi:PhoX family protein [Noviherbaspirillum sedimenti]|uniref:PhoX family phosphatase n=1 Tax=Noviherbaspirillum sedimenti TaxID=2320865 RepID=A0A3A3GLS9_9BURK|nr:PhoX family phosphatase [Noviherbaspirillum sedimenti]RJG01940.1 PhoX family phosphatase [Noviherbaspirillum sedimenti]
MNKPKDLPLTHIDSDDIGHNTSNNSEFGEILNARISRRNMLRGGAVSAVSALFGSIGLSACGGSSEVVALAPVPPAPVEKLLGFAAVSKSLADSVVVPAGYTASIIYALGDPLAAATPAYKNDGTDTDYDNRAGDHHDGMEWFGLSGTGTPSLTSVDRGLLGMNHEATTDETKASFFLHANGGTTTLPRPAAEVDKEIPIHGVAIVEVKKTGAAWAYVKDSTFNRRITPMTVAEIAGPARGNALMTTKYSTAGTTTRGTINNCGTGKTPWGTLVTGEENWNGYFTRGAADNAARGNDKSVTSLNRYGKSQGGASRHGWESAGADDKYARWNIGVTGATAADDYRNEMNTFGYIVEIDPYDKTKSIKKRTALGRFAHESAAFGKLEAGKPLAVYQGDDSRGEYIYKFVSNANWDPADATAADRIATGDKYLDAGKLYTAKFNADGSGQWIELSISNAAISGYAGYAFADQADVLVNARLAADAVGATKMDRPEWCATNPANGEIYFTLTNNSNRTVNSATTPPDAANPRAYTDMKGATAQAGNPNGHLIRLREGAAGAAATAFTWDVYLFGAEASASKSLVNLSSLTDDQDFSSPDGLAFTPSTGICWIQTDDGAYTDVTNCMMLAALPGQIGDGAAQTLSYTKADSSQLNVTTPVGKAPTADTLKRFLVGPKASEITGICETPDGKALFVNIQHPGESTKAADIGDPTKYTSQWPSNAGFGAGNRPRSATIVITKNDGGRVGT